MTNYIDPFEKRTFSERFKAVFAFIKQNFVQVMKYDLLIFAAIAALVGWFTYTHPDSSINNLGGLVNFAAFAYFTHYIAKCGDVRTVSFKDMLKSMGSAFGKMIEASLLAIALVIPFVIVGAIYIIVVMAVAGGGNTAIVFAMLPMLLLIFYLTPFFSVYYVHYYFSCKLKDSLDALKESFRLVKGHWWSTFGFMMLFEMLQTVVLLPILLYFQEHPSFAGEWISTLLIFIVSFFFTHVAMVLQYGHLKALKEGDAEAEKTKIITVKMVITAIVIMLVCLLGASNAKKINSALPNLASMFGNSSAQNEIGRKYLKEQNYEEAIKYFAKAANKGNAAALNNLGVCYMNGYGVEMDKDKARQLYIQAAEKGDPMAMHNLAKNYVSGNGVEKDEKEAVKWWRKAAEMDFAAAKYRLGRCYEGGIGVEKNKEEAFNWFMEAAKDGNASAQYRLGMCYKDGRGTIPDSLKAFNWINKAAAQGHTGALNQLAYCYAEGVGTDADMSMAHATIDKAIQIDPNEANLYDSKGEFYMLTGDRENARAMYEKVIEMDSTFYEEVLDSKLYHYINNKETYQPIKTH